MKKLHTSSLKTINGGVISGKACLKRIGGGAVAIGTTGLLTGSAVPLIGNAAGGFLGAHVGAVAGAITCLKD